MVFVSSNSRTRSSVYSSSGYTAAWRITMAPSPVASSTTRDSSAMPAALSTERGMVTCPFLPIFASSMDGSSRIQVYRDAGKPATRITGPRPSTRPPPRRDGENRALGDVAVEDQYQLALIPVFLERSRIGVGVGERYVAVGAHQIECVARNAVLLGHVAPWQGVQRQAERRARLGQTIARHTVDVRLPLERLERREVVGDPPQPVAAVHAARVAGAERAVAILDLDLRERAEEEAARRFIV